MTRRLLLAALALAAATTTTEILDGQTGEREGRIVEQPSGSIDLFDRDSGRIGWGKTDATGTQLFDPQGNRIGTLTPNRGGSRSLWLNRPAGKGGKR